MFFKVTEIVHGSTYCLGPDFPASTAVHIYLFVSVLQTQAVHLSLLSQNSDYNKFSLAFLVESASGFLFLLSQEAFSAF